MLTLFHELRQEISSSVDQTVDLGRSGESYCGYVLKMELPRFANDLDIGEGFHPLNTQLLWVLLSEGKGKVSGGWCRPSLAC